jgi:hypothetical protein
LANAEEYNDNLHEEVHQLHNQLHPYVPLGVAEMDLDEERIPRSPKHQLMMMRTTVTMATSWT